MLCLWLLRVHLICVSLLYLRAAVDYFVLLAILGRPLLLPRAAHLPHGRAAWLVCVVCACVCVYGWPGQLRCSCTTC